MPNGTDPDPVPTALFRLLDRVCIGALKEPCAFTEVGLSTLMQELGGRRRVCLAGGGPKPLRSATSSLH